VNGAALRWAAGLTLLAAIAPAGAAGAPKLSEAEATYRQERARCLRDESGQDRPTCLKEAAAARQEAVRDGLRKPRDTNLSRNATQRCDAQPAADRDACVQRILGAGTTRGSVQGGGLIRESETPTR
jgi:hypothetical protein